MPQNFLRVSTIKLQKLFIIFKLTHKIKKNPSIMRDFFYLAVVLTSAPKFPEAI